MINANPSPLVISSKSSGKGELRIERSDLNRTNPDHHPIAILWDIENCPVPSDVRPEYVAGNIRMALRIHPIVKGFVTMFSAYGDFNAFPRKLREGCQRTGVKLVDVPNGRKDAADKAILVDMFLFALDSRPPSSIVLISGDVDFSPALHVLGQRGYNVILVVPTWTGVSSALCTAGRFVWDWHSVARGEGFVSSREFPLMPQPLTNEVSAVSSCNPSDFDSTCSALPVGISSLKQQLVKLLELSGGCMPLSRIHSDYQRIFGKPLFVSEYGVCNVVNLIRKMNDVIAIVRRGKKKFACLQNRNDSLEEYLEIDKVILVKECEKRNGVSFKNLNEFKHELQDILVSYSCRIFVDCFEEIYEQRYKKPLCCKRFGVIELEELFVKAWDVVALCEEPLSKRKYLVATCG